ncbi:MAG: lipoyl(octanoyl) transferase LipB, partial [Thermoguttaceae bacterium]
MRELHCLDLGRRAYQPVLQLQRQLVRRLQDDAASPAYLILVEHDPPVITLGRRANRSNVLAEPERLDAAGVQLHHTSRGGDVTWHGPGQLVAYPVLSLGRTRLPVHRYVNRLEAAVISLLDSFGIVGRRRQGFPGVWVNEKKIAAVGVAVDRWVCYHGFALNVGADLSGFDLIRPCGLSDARPTSISRELRKPISIEEVKPPLLQRLAEHLEMEPVQATGGGRLPR